MPVPLLLAAEESDPTNSHRVASVDHAGWRKGYSPSGSTVGPLPCPTPSDGLFHSGGGSPPCSIGCPSSPLRVSLTSSVRWGVPLFPQASLLSLPCPTPRHTPSLRAQEGLPWFTGLLLPREPSVLRIAVPRCLGIAPPSYPMWLLSRSEGAPPLLVRPLSCVPSLH